MRRLKVKQVDVFTAMPFCGNPAAVILDARGLDADAMQAIAREMNLSETTFVLPPSQPQADYLLRIFTPRSELPFAGHPTIATVHAIIEQGELYEGRIPGLIRQECGIGIVSISVEKKNDGVFFMVTHAEPRWAAIDLGRWDGVKMLDCHENDLPEHLPMEIVSTGASWLVIPLRNLGAIKALKPNMALVEKTCAAVKAVGVTVFSLEAEREGHEVHVRSFAPGQGIPEDPVCGTGNGSVAAYIAKHGLKPGEGFEYRAEQGAEILRPGTVVVRGERGKGGNWTIQVGGQAVTVLVGEILT